MKERTPPLSPDVARQRKESIWQVWVDTGGTFTDCVARDPAGGLHRAKVLSTSALRGIVGGAPRGRRLPVQVEWQAPPDFVRGFRFRLLVPHRSSSSSVPVGDRSRSSGIRSDDLSGSSSSAWPVRSTTAPLDEPESIVESFMPGDPALLELSSLPPGSVQRGMHFEVQSPEEAPLLSARLVTCTPAGGALPPIELRLATTLATNALLERRLPAVALFVTRGFGDILEIGTQQRPDLFALAIQKPEALYCDVVEVPGRIGPDGSIEDALDLEPVRGPASRLLAEGVRSAAVALLNAAHNQAHELNLEEFLRSAGFEHVSRSSALASSLGLLARAQTAVVDACLAPVLDDYLAGIASAMEESADAGPRASPSSLHVMTSTGGLADRQSFRAKDALLSGPAAGVVGAARAGSAAGSTRLISFDMGGTSTDVARFDGDFDYRFEHRVAQAHLFAPALAIESVAAGGGSICAFEGQTLQVGPRSAGAFPGPACYGAGGPLTLTDVNLLLGRLQRARFQIPVSRALAEAALEQLRGALEAGTRERPPAEVLLTGLLEIADERIAAAIRKISVREGYDPGDYTLVAFGGAGGQHACAVARRLGMETIIIPPEPGMLSAWGVGQAPLEAFAERLVLAPLEEAEPRLEAWMRELSAGALDRVKVVASGLGEAHVRRRLVALRFSGQDSTLVVDYDPDVALGEAFRLRHLAVFGHAPEKRTVEVESLRVVAVREVTGSGEASSHTSEASPPASVGPSSSRAGRTGGRGRRLGTSHPMAAAERATVCFAGTWQQTPVHERAKLRTRAVVRGPALIVEPHSTVVVEPGWRADVDGSAALVLRRDAARTRRKAAPHGERSGVDHGRASAATSGERASNEPTGEQPASDAVRLELFTHRLAGIAAEMGEMLRRTALSVNVKERLDFSCAILDREGELVVNAPHIPVHLGGLGLCVRALRDELPLEPGDVAVTNHPAFGGSHLPDVTVVTAVHSPAGRLVGYVANRAHHAEIGGSRPGSMPPFARSLLEEGVIIPPTLLVHGGLARWDEARRLLREAPYPSRAVEENIADLRAAVAANHMGVQALQKLMHERGEAGLERSMQELEARAERRLREALDGLTRHRYEALERMDDGSPLAVTLDLSQRGLRVDFSGSAGVHPGNLNATPAIVRSAVIYVLRLLVREALPLNEGLLRPVELVIPHGILNPPFPSDLASAPAVGGGNVETSQRLVDTLIKALGLAACSQGTMNNVIFGNERFGYYETICGGAGAGADFDGATAVHTHMTNTRITDPEVLEHRYPVRVERFAVRRGSGGAGRRRGGDGAIRELRFRERVSLSILSQHRKEGPYGLEGGAPGRPGAQRLLRASGEVIELEAIDGCELEPGDRLVVETPGGGGYGRPGG
jgi:5-oxoprolinase (ATP-hydrolysing)